MATKHISDVEVCLAYLKARTENESRDHRWAAGGYGPKPKHLEHVYPYDLLAEWTGQPFKVCYRAMERASNRGYLNCGVSLRTGWVEPKGITLLAEHAASKAADAANKTQVGNK